MHENAPEYSAVCAGNCTTNIYTNIYIYIYISYAVQYAHEALVLQGHRGWLGSCFQHWIPLKQPSIPWFLEAEFIRATRLQASLELFWSRVILVINRYLSVIGLFLRFWSCVCSSLVGAFHPKDRNIGTHPKEYLTFLLCARMNHLWNDLKVGEVPVFLNLLATHFVFFACSPASPKLPTSASACPPCPRNQEIVAGAMVRGAEAHQVQNDSERSVDLRWGDDWYPLVN